MTIWYRWISPYRADRWYKSTYETKEQEQDAMRKYMDPLHHGTQGTMYEITDICQQELECSHL